MLYVTTDVCERRVLINCTYTVYIDTNMIWYCSIRWLFKRQYERSTNKFEYKI